jgi:hypothetical protein
MAATITAATTTATPIHTARDVISRHLLASILFFPYARVPTLAFLSHAIRGHMAAALQRT